MNWFFFAYCLAGALCLAYWLICCLARGFRQSALWMWPAVGAFCLLWAQAHGAAGAGLVPAWLRLTGNIAVCALLAAFFGLEALIARGMFPREARGAEYVIVLGTRVEGEAPSRALAARARAAAVYLSAHPLALAVTTGGRGPREAISEAECIRRELVARGVAEERILIEDASRTTCENLRFARALIGREAFVVVVSDGYHLYRAIRLAKGAGFARALGVSSGTLDLLLPHDMMREFLASVVDAWRGHMTLW